MIICEIETLELPPNLFCLKSSVRSRIRLRSADARLRRPWPELGGMADQAALGRRGRARSFVRGSAVGLDFSLQCTAARAGFTQECVRAAFANRLCESLGCLDLREH